MINPFNVTFINAGAARRQVSNFGDVDTFDAEPISHLMCNCPPRYRGNIGIVFPFGLFRHFAYSSWMVEVADVLSLSGWTVNDGCAGRST
jgi:hypothetical protein